LPATYDESHDFDEEAGTTKRPGQLGRFSFQEPDCRCRVESLGTRLIARGVGGAAARHEVEVRPA